jgi:hypothetical protein
MVVDTRAEERCVTMSAWGRALIAARAKVIHDFVFRFSQWNVERPIEPDFLGKMGEQAFERFNAQGRQHLAALDIGFRQITQERSGRER